MLSLVLAFAVTAQARIVDPPFQRHRYAGEWNVRITDAPDTFVSGGFQVDRDEITAGLVWRWGSFLLAKSTAVKNGTLRIVRDEEGKGKLDVFEARLEGGGLKGQVTYPDGKVAHFEGRRAPTLDSKRTPKWGAPVTMFDGRTLNGWRLRDLQAKNGWAVVNGELAVVEPKGNADLVSEKTFQDMKLHLEFNVDKGSNSGVYLRGRYEVQILDNPDQKMALDSHGCGAIYSRLAPGLDATKPPGEWQTLDVTLVGRHVTVVLNGSYIVNGLVEGVTGGALSPWEDEPGPLMLQGDHGKVRFRNVLVTPAE